VRVFLPKSKIHSNAKIFISGSKSETNRLLLLQAFFPDIILDNVSNADDVLAMKNALDSQNSLIDIHHAGTAMRFLTAFFATQQGREVVLTGSDRMKQRPIKILVDALKQLGAEIEYVENDGFPPLKIWGKKLLKNEVNLAANVSSQYISALLLVAASLENGLKIRLEGEITSMPYIKMSLALLNELGVETSFFGNEIVVKHKNEIESRSFVIESDWSSASYFYAIVALSQIGTCIELSSFKQNSLQGDSVLAEIYRDFGVETTFSGNAILLKKVGLPKVDVLKCDLKSAPDIAQTIAVTCFGLGMGCELFGLHTLKIKETDRLLALKTELEKFGASVFITKDSLKLEKSTKAIENVVVATYQDHRMAMAFAPLALKVPLFVDDAEVVSKSFPNFWNDLKTIGFEIDVV
jgi:3-phosphoshikimate 1-carboxyvinyltransferase